jgi:type IV pilus assembly protein PilC
MANYSYRAVDPQGFEIHGSLEVADQYEALKRIKEMGLFPTKVAAVQSRSPTPRKKLAPRFTGLKISHSIPGLSGRVKLARLAVFTRQLATLIEAGMPLLRGLRILHEQEESRTLKRALEGIISQIESGESLSQALAQQPRIFNRLYINMVKAGEIGGALEVTLGRLADFLEKAQRLKGKLKAAMVYPCSVLVVAFAIVGLLVTFVVPRFEQIFQGLLEGRPLPAFTRLVFGVSGLVAHQVWPAALLLGGIGLLVVLALRTSWGRSSFDRFKLTLPVIGPLFRKAAIARFARTLGTLMSNGVPILQALVIVKETAGNVAVGQLVSQLHENVKEGDPLAPTLKSSPLFPAMVAGMIDVGEQTGALPEMLLKVADNYDSEVDNAASALTSLLEPVMIVFLAVIVGGIVIAMFLPILTLITGFDGPDAGKGGGI